MKKSLNLLIDNSVLFGIKIYQIYISPKKGYVCAYGSLHNTCGCSGYAKQSIKEYGLFKAYPLISERFTACGEAYKSLLNTNSYMAKGPCNRNDGCGPCV